MSERTATRRREFSKRFRASLFNAYGGKCQYCVTGRAEVIDHIVPLARGGTNDFENLTAACNRCNGRKSDAVLPEAYTGLLLARAASRAKLWRQGRLSYRVFADAPSADQSSLVDESAILAEAIRTLEDTAAKTAARIVEIRAKADGLQRELDAERAKGIWQRVKEAWGGR